eukprot:180525-Chlamydomonas_euryale.AAC.2
MPAWLQPTSTGLSPPPPQFDQQDPSPSPPSPPAQPPAPLPPTRKSSTPGMQGSVGTHVH